MCLKHKEYSLIHCHTNFSLLDGVGSINQLVKKAKENNCKSIAINDHGNPAGLFSFYKECKKQDIKPVLGLEFYITNDLGLKKSYKDRTSLEDRDYHQSVYIKNTQGYKNFNYLTYKSFVDGFYYKPRIDFDLLFEKKEGLIITSSCMASKLSNYIRANDLRQAEDLFRKFVLEFGEDFYGEIQFNEIKGQKEINDFIIHLCNKYDIKTIIGGDVHYVNKEDNVLQDALIKSKRDSETDWAIEARNLYFHTPSDYVDFNKRFGYNYSEKFIETCLENSNSFSDKANFEFETGKYHFPKVNTGKETSKEFLERIVWEGAKKKISEDLKYFPDKYTNDFLDKIEKQVAYELEVFDKLELNDYFLIVYDIIKFCKENDIYVGPGRGSAGASTALYFLNVTEVLPLEHNLIFERFVNPTRKTMADIDLDFSEGGRDKILEYLVSKYGQEAVMNVSTFGTYKPKSALQAMSRGLGKPTGQDSILMKKISKLPELVDKDSDSWNGEQLISYFEKVERVLQDEEIITWIRENKDVINFSAKILGNITQLGTHAGGILVTNGPAYNYIPITRSGSNIVTAFREADGSSKDLSELGLLKLDILGLSTLNIFKECVQRIKEDKGIDLKEKINHLPLDDKKLLDYFSKGKNYGIFQMERSSMFTSKIEVDSFKDIIAINAINRPGPLETFLDKYGYWKKIDTGKIQLTEKELEEVNKERYPFPFMEKVLKDNYGCLLYQENFMSLVCEAGGFNYGEADSFRRVFGWKEDNPKYYTIKDYYDRLEKGMEQKGYSKEDTKKFIQYCRDFAGYSFNISHSTCYAYVAYQCLFFKVYYPAYFFAAMINNENSTDKLPQIIEDAKLNNITILPQSITSSKFYTVVENDKTVRLGYGIIKGFGNSTEEELNSLNIKTLEDFLSYEFKTLNKTQLNNLLDLGVFDLFEVDRSFLFNLKELYSDEKIPFWFTRKKQALRLETCPESLLKYVDKEKAVVLAFKAKKENEKEPHKELIKLVLENLKTEKLIETKYTSITKEKQKELMDFTLSTIDISKYEETLRFKNYFSFKEEFKNDDKSYYFILDSYKKVLTKSKKEYLKLSFDGIQANYWGTKGIDEGGIYVANISKDTYGYTVKNLSKVV